ncbi:TBRG1 regulator, partial [Uria aalge]|nr:TBRG1 regulator [Uria aalge]
TGQRDGGRDEPRATGPKPVGPRDGTRPPGAGDGLRAGPREGSRPPGLREEPKDGPRPRVGPRDDSKAAAILKAPEDSPSPSGPPAAILRPPPRRRLPLALGPLTVQSLGAGGPAAILPVGFRSTRLYAGGRRPARRRLYTCRVVAGPRCEIVAEEEEGGGRGGGGGGGVVVAAGPTPDLCHGRLLQALGENVGRAPVAGAGADFFGLSHPVVRRLLREEEEEEEE